MSYRPLSEHSVFKKALELYQTSRALVSYISHNKDVMALYQSNSHRDHIADALLTDATLIPEQLAVAATSENPLEKQSSLSMIKIMTRNLQSYCNGLEQDGVKEKEYLNLLRSEIQHFRSAFKSWRRAL
jgi:hypothetical protein